MLSHSVMSDSLHSRELWPTRLLHAWDFSGKNTRVDCHFLLQGIFLTQGSNPRLLCLLQWQVDSLPPSYLGSPNRYIIIMLIRLCWFFKLVHSVQSWKFYITFWLPDLAYELCIELQPRLLSWDWVVFHGGIQTFTVWSLHHCCCHWVPKSCPTLCNPWTATHQPSLSFTISWSLFRLLSIESVMPSNHLILCCPLPLSSIFPSIKVFSSEWALCIRWPKYLRFSF